MLHWNFLLNLSQCIIILHAGFIQDKLFDGMELHLDRVNAECRGKNVPCQGFFQGITSNSTKIFVRNYTLLVKEDGLNKLMVTIIINRCRSKENLDTCEQYVKQPNIDFCQVINPKNVITSQVSIAFPMVPPLKCPLTKGISHAYNFTFDLAPFMFFNGEGWYWKSNFDIYNPDQKRLLYCSQFEGYATKSKTKGN